MKRKRIVSLFLAAVLLLSFVIPIQAASPGLSNFKKQSEYTGFADVPETAWYAESVKTVCEYGLMNGKSTSLFDPTGNISTAEALALACRLHSIYSADRIELEQSSPWYQSYIDYWHDFSGISYKNNDDSAWRKPITRELFAYLLGIALPDAAYQKINDIAVGTIVDVAFNDYTDSIYRLFNAGIITGTNGWFNPRLEISRAEVSAIISRIVVSESRVKTSDASLPVNLFIDETPFTKYVSANNGIKLTSNNDCIVVAAYVTSKAASMATSWESENTSIATVEVLSRSQDMPVNCSLAVVRGVSTGSVYISAKNGLGNSMSFYVDVDLPQKQSQPVSSPNAPSNNDHAQVEPAPSQSFPEASTHAQPESCDYVINTNTKKFHYPWCRYVAKMAAKNTQYYTGSRDSLISRYDPCKVCRP